MWDRAEHTGQGARVRVMHLPPPLACFAWELTGRTLRCGAVSALYAVEARLAALVPLMTFSAVCGFPSPADNYVEGPLDFNELLIDNQSATFAVRIAGDSMTGAGMFPGDIAVVDRAKAAVNGVIVLALLADEFTIKRYRVSGGRTWLQAENPAFRDIELNEDSGFEGRRHAQHSHAVIDAGSARPR